MSMEIIEKSGRSDIATKPMKEMKEGEVCKIVDADKYVVAIKHHMENKKTFLILGDKDFDNYGNDCPRRVRELFEGEEVIVKFS